MRPVPVNDDGPWTAPATTVSRGTLALVTTAGLHHRDDAPFVKYDQSYRVIDAGVRERPAEVSRADFLRYCSDDLKAMYLEGRIAMKPTETPDQALRWLWGETALGALLVEVKNHMEKSADDSIRDAAFGIAR
jgi:hypothetical protein